ncbi:MAG: hypothetical protein PHX88_06765 [Methanoculleus horonobensis]|nr:hypothetical protein [Methanoculleus horonobensis]
MVRNYDRGYSPEVVARDNLLPAHGFVAWKAWASKGPFDVYGSRSDLMLLVQVKRTKARIVSPRAVTTHCKKDIHGDGKKKIGMKNIPTPPACRKQVWLYSDKVVGKDLAGWRYYALEGDQLVPLTEPVPGWNPPAEGI